MLSCFVVIVYQLTSMITRLLFKDDQNDITRESKKEEFVSRIHYEVIVISHRGYISTEAI